MILGPEPEKFSPHPCSALWIQWILSVCPHKRNVVNVDDEKRVHLIHF